MFNGNFECTKIVEIFRVHREQIYSPTSSRIQGVAREYLRKNFGDELM